MNKNKLTYQNYLTSKNNCKVVNDVQQNAKPMPIAQLNPANILSDNLKQIWLSEELPATCIIDMRGMKEKPLFFNRVGFYCWHEYQSNPKLIELSYSSKQNLMGKENPHNYIEWTVISKIRLQMVSGWQQFKLPMTSAKSINYLKVSITQNHASGGQNQQEQTKMYLNQMSMGYIQDMIIDSRVSPNENDSGNNQRDKTFSDYRKLTSSEKQIKKLMEKYKVIANQNQIMKRTIDHQSTIILKLQQTIEGLAQNITKIQKVQTLQDRKIKRLERINGTEGTSPKPNIPKTQSFKPHKLQDFFNDQSQIVNRLQFKNNPRSKQKQKSSKASRNHSIYQQPEYDSHQTQKSRSIYRSKKSKTSNYQKNQPKQHKRSERSTHSKQPNKHRQHVINAANLQNSGQSLSQYQGIDEAEYTKTGVRGNNRYSQSKQKSYTSMLEKLQGLIMLRDEKKNKLRSNRKSKGSAVLEEEYCEDENSDEYQYEDEEEQQPGYRYR